MISRDKDDKLIRIYFYICDKFEELQFYCERFSNNNEPEFTDQEVMTIYLYTMHHEGHRTAKQVHRFASEYLNSWFPKLGGYQAFNNRLNRLGGAFTRLIEMLLADFQPDDCLFDQSLLDPMPIITCSGKRSGKVAREVTDKGYCSPKGYIIMGLSCTCWAFGVLANCPILNKYCLPRLRSMM